MNKFIKDGNFYPQNFFFSFSSLCDADFILGDLAEEAKAADPDFFDGETDYFIFRFLHHAPFVSQYEFPEMRRLQNAAMSNTRYKAEFNGIIAIDVSEWLGHESEEHFTNCLLFLKSMTEHWKYVFFTLGPERKREQQRLMDKISSEIWVVSPQTSHLISEPQTHGFSEFLGQEDPQTGVIFADRTVCKLLEDSFDLTNENDIRKICTDIKSYYSSVPQITTDNVTEYLNDPCTYGHFLMKSSVKETDNEKI